MSTVVMAYAAALIVAFVTTVAFTPTIEQMLFRLLPEEAAPPWSMFVRFALFVTSFVGGKPVHAAAAAAATPLAGDNFMIVMNSMGGALMAAAWFLLAFFAGTLGAVTAIRVYAIMSQRRALAAEREAQKTRQDRTETHGEPIKRQEAAEPRPVKQEKPAPRPPQPR
jgi:hypothetical protein